MVAAVVVGVPLYQVTLPIQEDWQGAGVARATALQMRAEAQVDMDLVPAEISELVDSLRSDEENSNARAGWLPAIQQTRQSLAAKRARLTQAKKEITSPLPVAPAWWTMALAMAPAALSLAFFQALNVWSIRRISAFRYGPDSSAVKAMNDERVPIVSPATTTPASVPMNGGTPEESRNGVLIQSEQRLTADDLSVRRLQRAIKERLDRNEFSQAEWCRRHRVHPRDLSYLFHHFKRKAEGKQVLSAEKLRALASHFAAEENDEKRDDSH